MRGVELDLAHEDAAPRIAKTLGFALGDDWKAVDWCELNRDFLHCP